MSKLSKSFFTTRLTQSSQFFPISLGLGLLISLGLNLFLNRVVFQTKEQLIEAKQDLVVEQARSKRLAQSLMSSEKTSEYFLKKMIADQYPNINNSSISDIEKVNILREFAYKYIDFSAESLLIDRKDKNFYQKNAPEIFALFLEDEGGVYCGGAAYALKKLYELYGYKSYTYDMGKVDVMTHVVTLVEVDDQKRQLILIQDPTFNITYAQANGNAIDFFDFISSLKAQDHKNITVIQNDKIARDYLSISKEKSGNSNYLMESSESRRSRNTDSKKYAVYVTLKRFEEIYGQAIARFLKTESQPGEVIYLYLYPIQMGGNGHQLIMDKLSKIIDSPITTNL